MEIIQLKKREVFKLQAQWKEIYASRLIESEGKWKYESFAWCAFSGNSYKSIKGNDAIRVFENLNPSEYYVFDISLPIGDLIKDPEALENDEYFGIDSLYCATDFSWTFVTAHEYEYGAPFFATKNERECLDMLARLS